MSMQSIEGLVSGEQNVSGAATPSTNFPVDKTLTVAGYAADAKATGDAIRESVEKTEAAQKAAQDAATVASQANVAAGNSASRANAAAIAAQEAQKAAELAEEAAKGHVAQAENTVKTALAEAKASGEFDGKDGEPGQDGKDGQPGADGEPGKDGADGTSFIQAFSTQIEESQGKYSTVHITDLTCVQAPIAGDIVVGANGWMAMVTEILSDTAIRVGSLGLCMRGADGAPGEKGDTGAKGDKGDPGEKGDTGAAGKDGTSVTVSSMKESTDDGGTNVITFSDGNTIHIKNGSKGSAGEKGDTGATGPQGPQGETGPLGPQGAKGDKGDTGAQGPKGDTGATGADGKSAYAYAQDGGYTGTETAFAEKLAAATPTQLPNPNALTINNKTYDGSAAVNLTDTINGMIDAKAFKVSITRYGATGDGSTDDTAAFQNALAENRTVYVPGGTYKLSAGIAIGDNCELELAQDAVLEFTQTTGNCITLNMSSSLKGNHATVNVPYAFSGNVLYAYSADTTSAETNAVPPFTRWSPQWKAGRYVTDLNICKADYRGFHYAVNVGDCCGTAVYLSANATSGYLTYMWGVHYSGLRIAGAFEYGIRAVNLNDGWLHEMRVDAFIDACETGVSLEDCNQAYVSAIIQPRRALNADGKTEVSYAKHGIKLVRSKNADLSGSRVWDWNETNALWTEGGEHQFLCLYGDCRGAILNAFQYYATSYDIRDLIYTDTASNLEQITILQEPITRWFKPVDGEPYFSDGYTEKKLATQEELEALFGTTLVAKFTNQLPIATDTDGTIYNGIGYKIGADINGYYPPVISSSTYATLTGFIPVQDGSTIYFKDLWWTLDTGYERIVFFDKDKNPIQNGSYTAFISSTQIATSGANFLADFQTSGEGFQFTLGTNALLDNVGYVRVTFNKLNIGTNPTIAVDEELVYEQAGVLVDSVKIKAENVIGGLTTSDVNTLISSAIGGAIGGSY